MFRRGAFPSRAGPSKGFDTSRGPLLREVAECGRLPRALCLPDWHGYPLDTRNDAARQHGRPTPPVLCLVTSPCTARGT
jgi:hypothetical protein